MNNPWVPEYRKPASEGADITHRDPTWNEAWRRLERDRRKRDQKKPRWRDG